MMPGNRQSLHCSDESSLRQQHSYHILWVWNCNPCHYVSPTVTQIPEWSWHVKMWEMWTMGSSSNSFRAPVIDRCAASTMGPSRGLFSENGKAQSLWASGCLVTTVWKELKSIPPSWPAAERQSATSDSFEGSCSGLHSTAALAWANTTGFHMPLKHSTVRLPVDKYHPYAPAFSLAFSSSPLVMNQ